ncbi:MAG: LacI family DNA-binding transcriptional regulator [Terrimicrobiaceae bacterium]
MRQDKVPTTREIAVACGCNQSTVSHALRDHSKIPEATRARIQSIALKMGWKPNALASAYMAHLRATRTPAYQATLGFIVDDMPATGRIADLPGHTQRYLQGARDRATQLGYALDPIPLPDDSDAEIERLARVLKGRGIPGLIISSFAHPDGNMSSFPWSEFAAVTLGYTLLEPPLHRVVSNTFHGFHFMIKKAFALGYKNLGVVISEEYDRITDHGVLFPVSYEKERVLPGRSIRTLVLPSHEPKEIPRIQKWLKKNRPDIVLGVDLTWVAIQEMGWKVPTDVAFIIADRDTKSDLAGFDQLHENHGEIAVDLLVGQLLHNERGIPLVPKFEMVEGCWRDGASAPPCHPASAGLSLRARSRKGAPTGN